MRLFLSFIALLSSGLVASYSLADVNVGFESCHVKFTSDFTVEPKRLSSEQAQRQFEFAPDGSVRVDGEALALDGQQRQLAADYVLGVQAFMPEMLGLVADTLEILGKVFGEAFSEAFGADSEAAVKIQTSMDQARAKLAARIDENQGAYHVHAKGIDVIDEVFDDEFESAIEDAAQASMGSIWSLVGTALFTGEGSFESRMEAFGEKMEAFGDRIDKEMQGVDEGLEKRGEGLCERARQIDKLENRLRETVPELAHYRLMDSRAKTLAAETQGD